MRTAWQVVNLGRYDIDTWYYSPYPEPYRSVDRLYICEYDLKYFRKRKSLEKHLANDVPHHPPGAPSCCLGRFHEVVPLPLLLGCWCILALF